MLKTSFLRSFTVVLNTTRKFSRGGTSTCTPLFPGISILSTEHLVKSQVRLVSLSWLHSATTEPSSVPSSQKKTIKGIHENLSSLQTKTRSQRRRTSTSDVTSKAWSITAYSTAEEYDLERIKVKIADQQLYVLQENKMEKDYAVQDGADTSEDVLHVVACYNIEDEPREMFFFREGTCVFWNVPSLEAFNLLRFLQPFETNSYDKSLVISEGDSMLYTYGPKTTLVGGTVHLATDRKNHLEKYTFSNALALSVKLGIWESSLNKYVESIEIITEDLKLGRKILMSREEVLRKQGEIFALRHLINLSSDLLDTPDFYWDNEELEKLYMETVAYFSISRRTRVMNEKLNHCLELIELVSSHLSDKHHVRLEWMIIILIMVEVAFEVLHFMHH